MQPQIVHEAEVHRQHVRLKIPVTVEIDGHRFVADDWSMGGFGVQGELTSRQVGERLPARLLFPFEDFELALRADCQLVYRTEDGSRFGCRFTAMSAGQATLFRYVIDAYLSGELLSAGDLLALAGREGAAQVRRGTPDDPLAVEDARGRRVRRWLGYGLASLAAIGLAAVIWLGIEQRWLTLRAETAVIEAPLYRPRAPAPGILEAAPAKEIFEPGDPIGFITEADGTRVPVSSPCECVLLDWRYGRGQYVLPGEPLALLVDASQPLVVRAGVSPATAARLVPGARAEIVLPGGGLVPGQVERLDFTDRLAALAAGHERRAGTGTVDVVVRPDRPLDFDALGAPVGVRFP
ncbi:PilZ domain-containing protein [Geminicoccaceae bacterium 1502E]|nr:PilZ domain-containing protein [Geminicoccaceae bacterium 1502E]